MTAALLAAAAPLFVGGVYFTWAVRRLRRTIREAERLLAVVERATEQLRELEESRRIRRALGENVVPLWPVRGRR